MAKSKKGKGKKSRKKKKKVIPESPKETRDLLYAAEHGDLPNLLHILDNPDRMVNLLGGAADAIHLAAEGGFEAGVRALLRNGANPDTKGGKALHKSAAGGFLGCIHLLLEYGADANLRAPFSDYSPLHFAAQAGAREGVQALLEYGAEIDAIANKENCGTSNGWTALHFAADGGHLDVVDILLQFGAPIDFLSTAGDTPLALAAEHGKFDVATALVTAGADMRAKRRGLNVLQWACYRCNAAAAEFMCSYGAHADLTTRVPWFTTNNKGEPITLAQQIKLDVSETLWRKLDSAIYRGGKKFYLRAKHREIVSSITWDRVAALDPLAIDERRTVTTHQFDANVVALICSYGL